MAPAAPADEAQSTLRGVQVTVTLDAPITPADEIVAALLERVDGYITRALVAAGKSLIPATVDSILEAGLQAGSYWPTGQQALMVDDLLAAHFGALEAAVRADVKRRLLLDLATTVVPRLSTPSQEGTS